MRDYECALQAGNRELLDAMDELLFCEMTDDAHSAFEQRPDDRTSRLHPQHQPRRVAGVGLVEAQAVCATDSQEIQCSVLLPAVRQLNRIKDQCACWPVLCLKWAACRSECLGSEPDARSGKRSAPVPVRAVPVPRCLYRYHRYRDRYRCR